jgi:hypothetical protein
VGQPILTHTANDVGRAIVTTCFCHFLAKIKSASWFVEDFGISWV